MRKTYTAYSFKFFLDDRGIKHTVEIRAMGFYDEVVFVMELSEKELETVKAYRG